MEDEILLFVMQYVVLKVYDRMDKWRAVENDVIDCILKNAKFMKIFF